jgi:hypothetical protein
MSIEDPDLQKIEQSLPTKEKLSGWLKDKGLNSLVYFVDHITDEDIENIDALMKEVDPESGIYKLTWAGKSQQQRIGQILGQLRTGKNPESREGDIKELLAMLS